MNIMMNTYCNLKYPYYFADNEINLCGEKNLSEENFNKIITILKNNNIHYKKLTNLSIVQKNIFW